VKKTKKVYIGLTADILHHGHMNLLEVARKYGDIIIGLFTDSAVAEYKRLPYLNYKQREKILKNFRGVIKVVPQKEWDYSYNVKKIRPDYMVHGDDWKVGPDRSIRKNVIKILNSYGGKLIEVPYTKGISSGTFVDSQRIISTTPDVRRSTLSRLINSKPITRIIETHSPISAIIAEKTILQNSVRKKSFDGFWSSSLTDSTVMGKPDTESLEISQRLSYINDIFEVTTKPLIFDGDTGGKIEHFPMKVKSMDRLGISAIIIEDKTGLKKNSLFKDTSKQVQEDKNKFAEKISIGKKAKISDDFMIIARIESLILNKGMRDATERAKKYVEAGADAIMIHSKSNSPKEIFEFSKKFRKNFKNIPLVSVPTSYNKVSENELAKNGFNVVIYANQMLRAAYPAMQSAASKILKYGRSKEIDKQLISIEKILELIPGTK
tara:strand:- start:6589 stop:7896 length:1308 start_codon:yes stop_codon:yes gene_type:complete